MCCVLLCFLFFFFNDTATTEIYTLSLHDALPIWVVWLPCQHRARLPFPMSRIKAKAHWQTTSKVWLCSEAGRSEEHTSELQSQSNLVCRLLLEKKKQECPSHRLTSEE